MKSPLFLCLLIISSLAGHAQAVDLDKYYFTATYRSLPTRPLDTSWRTYSVTYETGQLVKLAMKDDMLTDRIFIEGWKKLSANGHIVVKLKLEDVLVEKSEVKEREQILKDKNGKQTGVRKFYWVVLTYNYAAQTSITDYRGGLVDEWSLMDRSVKHTFTSEEYPTRAQAEAFFAINALNVTSEIMRRVTNNICTRLSNELTTNYGFTELKINDFLWILDSRKHPEYDAHRNAFTLVKQAMFQMNANEPVDKIREMLQPAIAYFEKVKKNYSSNNRKQRKLRYASYFNLAKIYYYLDDPDAAMHQATGLVMNDFDARDGRALENAANNLKSLMEQNKVKSRHFPINVDAYTGPQEAYSSAE